MRPSRLVRFGVFEFDVDTGDLWDRGHRTRLQDQPRQVLRMLLEHPGELITRDALRAALWPHDTFVDFDAGLNVVVNKIRHVLHDSAASPRFIETLPRHGYRFIAPVTSVPAHGDQPPDTSDADGLNSQPRRSGAWLVRLSGGRVRRGMGLVAVVALAAVIAVVYLPRSGGESSTTGQTHAPQPSPSNGVNEVVVATFDNRTGDSSLDALGRSVAEQIIRVVATVEGVEVRPQPIATRVGDSSGLPVPLSNTNASLLVTGAYYAQGNRLEFQAQILDVASGHLLHGTESLSGSRSRPEEVIGRIQQSVAGAIAIHFDEFFGGLHAVSHPPTLDAYREYRAGLEIFWSDYPRALSHLDRSLEKAPEFLLPSVIKYIARGNLGEFGNLEPALARMERESDRFTPAERLVVEWLRSISRNRFAEAYGIMEDLGKLVPESLFVNHNLVQGSVVVNRPRAAVQAYDKRRFNGRDFRHGIGALRQQFVIHALHMLGEHDRELRQARLAQQYAPGDPHFLELEAVALVALGRVADVSGVIDRSLSITVPAGVMHTPGEVMEGVVRELRTHGYQRESLTLADRTIEWYHNHHPGATGERAHRYGLARALYLAERWEESRTVFAALAAEFPDDVGYGGYLGLLAARMQDVVRARGVSAELAGVPPGPPGRRSAFPSYCRSRIAALIGERQRAVELLREALAQGWPYGLEIHSEPDFESIRDDEEFVELIRPRG